MSGILLFLWDFIKVGMAPLDKKGDWEGGKMGIKAVIFDIGGTLIDYPFLDNIRDIRDICEEHGQDIAGSNSEVLKRMGEIYLSERRLSLDNFRETLILTSLIRAGRELGIPLNALEQEEIIRRFYFQWGKNAKLYKGARKLLEDIKVLNLGLGLVSNTPFPGELHEEDLKRFRIFPYFDIRIWSSEFGIRKPHPAIFKRAIAFFGIKPNEAVYIGDQFNRDVEGPQNIGMTAIWINRKREQRNYSGWQIKELKEATKIVNSLLFL